MGGRVGKVEREACQEEGMACTAMQRGHLVLQGVGLGHYGHGGRFGAMLNGETEG